MLHKITSKHSIKNKNNEILPFRERKDLTKLEIDAVSGYQDIGNRQHVWEFPDIPKDEKHHDCYIINKSLRDKKFRRKLSHSDKIAVKEIINNLDSAIKKSNYPHNAIAYKGLDDASWILQHTEKQKFRDNAFGSFSLDIDTAIHYAKPRDNMRVFISREVTPFETVLFIDDKEHELLYPRRKKYIITKIIDYKIGEFAVDSEARIYYITER